MLAEAYCSKKRLAAEGVGVKRHKKKAKLKRPRGTKFISFTCELDKDNCILDQNGLCIVHKTPAGKSKVGCLVNPEVATQLSCGSNKKVKFKCDVCFHVFSIMLCSITCGIKWCGMCSKCWKHCGVVACTFCFDRSFASFEELTLNDEKKVDCAVNKADLRLAFGSRKKVKFKCDVCLHPFSSRLADVTSNGSWCPTCKNKTELMVLNFLQDEMNIKVVTQYIPGGMKQMKKNYGKFGKLDFYLPEFNLIWELDGRQHNTQVIRFGNTSLFKRMILDKWKEFLVRKEGMNVIRFDQVAIWRDKYDWKQEMKNLLTLTSPDKLRRQLKATKKRYKMYAKEHNDKSKRRIVPEIVKRSHKKADTPILF